jgi:hypothetical protein
MLRSIAALGALVLVLTAPAFAQVAGTYAVEGADAQKHKYQGTVTVTPEGENFRIVWKIGNETYRGTGLSAGEALAVSYSWANNTGVALYVKQGDGWVGVWTSSDQKGQGSEFWTRR